ncbi:MAG TPA: ribosome assembly RNA-binding protein YhbY [Polyangiaceae bacterium]|nr:ribosome assembly RNA-binding protein YhbY [Polyangiaceae bacterium]
MTLTLTGKQRRHLRALAHSHKPVVQIGHAGLTPAVVAAVEQALETHELVKVRVSGEATQAVSEIGAQLALETRSSLAQEIGRTILLYRRRQQSPTIVLPKAGPARSTAKGS